ncbi:hypothetical protein MPTK1_6g09300 [Marchantia polymorpha subsp. ruderalis]
MCWAVASCRKRAQAMEDTAEDSLIPGLPEDIASQCLARVPLTSLWGVCKRWQEMVDKSEEFHFARSERGKTEMKWLYTLVRTKEGRFAWNAFDPLNERWHALPDMPETVDFQLTSPGSIGMSHAVQCVSTRNKLVMVAGLKSAQGAGGSQSWSQLEPALQQPWVFDPKIRQWKKGQDFSTPRKWCVCGVSGDKVYVASGSGQQWDMGLSRTTEMYDIDADSWAILPDLESSKFSGEAISAVNVEGNLHIVSGRGVFMKEGAVFCPVSKKWSKMRPGLKRGWTMNCVSVNNRFFAIDEALGKLSTYDADTDSWKIVLENPQLKDMTNVVTSDGLICGLIDPATANPEADGCTLRIVDVTVDPPVSFTHTVPQGRVVSLQILAKMNVQT